MTGSSTDLIVFLVVVGARFLVPLLIPRFPLPAISACLVIDAADQSIFAELTDLDLSGYQSYDKALDIYYLTIAYLAVIRNWTNGFAVEVARFLWYYRLVGVVAFELTHTRALLFVFPNTFEYYFIAYEALRTGWDPRRLLRSHVLWLSGFIWVVIKLPQEWWIHIAQNDFTDFVQETLFGVDPSSTWADSFANRPGVAAVLALGLIAVAVGLRTAWRRRPPQDWPVRFDVDAPVPEVDLPHVERFIPDLRWPIVEKTVLITMIGVIFGQMLDLELSNLEVLTATASVVVANASLSAWLGRTGTEWRSLGVEFVVLAGVNTVLLSILASLAGDGSVNRAATLFFGLLLTLIITLYDRFRAVRKAWAQTGARAEARVLRARARPSARP